jgi:two-component system sensor histidine kinase KdpD
VFIAAALLAGWVAGMSRNLAIRLKRREQELMKVIAQREDLRREKEEEMIRREAEGLRNAILTSVSHDLKTPLASIIGAVSSLKRHGHSLSEEDKTHLQTSVLGEANKLSGYVSNLLEMAKLEHGTAALRHETVAVDDLFDLTTKRMAGRLRTHAVEILPEEVPLSVQGDERLLDVALGNLLDNAVKFSPAGARIVLSAQTDEHGQVMVMVEDEGCGLPDDVPPGQALSDAFFRARREDRSNHGTGLGLWIAQRIAQAHGGSIDLRQGKTGVCAVLRLPLAVMPSLPQEEEEHA